MDNFRLPFTPRPGSGWDKPSSSASSELSPGEMMKLDMLIGLEKSGAITERGRQSLQEMRAQLKMPQATAPASRPQEATPRAPEQDAVSMEPAPKVARIDTPWETARARQAGPSAPAPAPARHEPESPVLEYLEPDVLELEKEAMADPANLLRPANKPLDLLKPTPSAQAELMPITGGGATMTGGATEVPSHLFEDMRRRIMGEHPGQHSEEVAGSEAALKALESKIQADETTSQTGQPATSSTTTFSAPSRRGTDSQSSPWLKTANEPRPQLTDVDMFADDTISPVALQRSLDHFFGEGWLGWEWETIEKELLDAGAHVSGVVRDKILALRLLANSDEFWESWRPFAAVVVAFSGRRVDWGWVESLAPQDMAAAIALVERFLRAVRPAWSDEVSAYAAACCIQAGYVMLPPELLFAGDQFGNELLKRMGDEGVLAQERLHRLLIDGVDDPSGIGEADRVQMGRLLRVQYRVQAAINEVNR